LRSGGSGFTRRPDAQGQFQLVVLPHDPIEIAVLFATSTVQAFTG
jgi:hypothetical protein